jgi:hypothetical protein
VWPSVSVPPGLTLLDEDECRVRWKANSGDGHESTSDSHQGCGDVGQELEESEGWKGGSGWQTRWKEERTVAPL